MTTPMHTPLPSMPLAVAPGVKPAGAEASAASAPALGADAVTQIKAARQTPTRTEDRVRERAADIPPDRPALKGLGVPGLHKARVGDADKAQPPRLPVPPGPQESFERLLADLETAERSRMDVLR